MKFHPRQNSVAVHAELGIGGCLLGRLAAAAEVLVGGAIGRFASSVPISALRLLAWPPERQLTTTPAANARLNSVQLSFMKPVSFSHCYNERGQLDRRFGLTQRNLRVNQINEYLINMPLIRIELAYAMLSPNANRQYGNCFEAVISSCDGLIRSLNRPRTT